MKSFRKLAIATFVLGLAFTSKPTLAATPYVMSGGDYAQDFSDIANWTANFAGGIGAANWSSVAINATGTIPDGGKTTTATATFSSGSSGGVQKGTGNIVLLSTGTTDNSTACAIDLNLDFSGRNAGTLSFDWAAIANSTGNRASSLRVYTSTDGTTWTELTGAEVLNISNNVVVSGSITTVALPVGLSGSATVRIRFYECNGAGGSTGSRAKISIDNVAVTSTGASGVAPSVTGISPSSVAANAGDTVSYVVTSTGDAPTYFWYKETSTSTNLIIGATTATLTLANVLAADAAGYQVVLSNATGVATSSVVTLTVADPIITQQPTSLTGLLNATATFSVGAKGTPALTYQWYGKLTADSDFTSATALSNGGRVSGADTASLSIANLTYADATNLFVVVTAAGNSITSSVVTLSIASTASLAMWDFNGNLNVTNPVPAQGVGTATSANCTTFSNSVASGNDFGDQNNGWGSSSYPAVGVSNKTAGVRFNVSTAGAKNIKVTFDTRATSTASKYERLQYTTNGTDFIDYPDSSSFAQNVSYESRSFDLTGFPGTRNNPNFAIRIVTEFDTTAKYGATNDDQYVGNGGTYAGSGTVSYDLVNITGDAITDANTPPTISTFTNLTTTDISSAVNINFTVGDAETPVGSLNVSATSDNGGVISSPSVSGSGANRVLTITPSAGQLGVAPIRVTVTDGNGDSSVTWFYVTVIAGNQPPTISGLVSTNMLGNITNTFSFTVGDDLTPVGSLTLSATSGNTTLLPDANISFGGSGANRTLIVTPTTNTFGVVPIMVMLNDGQKTTSFPFVLTVRPSTEIALNDYFDYNNSGSVISQSGGFWQTHSGTAGQIQVNSGQLFVTGQNSEDINAPLINAPYYVTNNAILYSKFTVQFTAVPTAGGTYFAHFKDATTSGFEGRIWASTLNAADGDYRLGIINGSGGTNSTAQFPLDLIPGTNYTVVTRLVLTNGFSTIWINPTSESDSGVTDTTVVSGPLNISTYAFRQSTGEGDMAISDLVVGTSFNAVMGVNIPNAIPLQIHLSGGNAVLTWSDASFSLQSSTNVAGPYTSIPAAAGLTTYVDGVTNAAVFYRLYHP